MRQVKCHSPTLAAPALQMFRGHEGIRADRTSTRTGASGRSGGIARPSHARRSAHVQAFPPDAASGACPGLLHRLDVCPGARGQHGTAGHDLLADRLFDLRGNLGVFREELLGVLPSLSNA